MSQKLKRPIQPANTQGSSTLLNRAFRAPLQMMMTLAELMSGRSLAGISQPAGFLGDAFRVRAVEGTNQITIRRGLGWSRNSGVDDAEWSGEVRPIYAEADLTATVGTNGAGLTREDSVFIRAVFEDLDSTPLNVKDTLDGPLRVETKEVTREYKIEVLVTAGTPGGSPGAAPSGDGWIKIAGITRATAVVNITQNDIIDRRGVSGMVGLFTSADLQATANLYLGLFKTAADFGYQFFTAQEDEGGLVAGDLVITDRAWNDVDPSGRVRMGEIVAHTRALISEIRPRVAGALQLLTQAGTGFEWLRSRNSLIGMVGYSSATGIATGGNVQSVAVGGASDILISFQADKQWGGNAQVFVAGTAHVISTGAPLIPVTLTSDATGVSFYLYNLAGTKVNTDFAFKVAVINLNPTV